MLTRLVGRRICSCIVILHVYIFIKSKLKARQTHGLQYTEINVCAPFYSLDRVRQVAQLRTLSI